ncbi:MAG: hypothetical protein AB7O45_02730 [Alphaproteobacteria bacterium]
MAELESTTFGVEASGDDLRNGQVSVSDVFQKMTTQLGDAPYQPNVDHIKIAVTVFRQPPGDDA